MRLNAHSLQAHTHTHSTAVHIVTYFMIARIGESAHQSHQVVNFLFAIFAIQCNFIPMFYFICQQFMPFYVISSMYLETLNWIWSARQMAGNYICQHAHMHKKSSRRLLLTPFLFPISSSHLICVFCFFCWCFVDQSCWIDTVFENALVLPLANCHIDFQSIYVIYIK